MNSLDAVGERQIVEGVSRNNGGGGGKIWTFRRLGKLQGLFSKSDPRWLGTAERFRGAFLGNRKRIPRFSAGKGKRRNVVFSVGGGDI